MNSLGKEDTGSDERRIHSPAPSDCLSWVFSFRKKKKENLGDARPRLSRSGLWDSAHEAAKKRTSSTFQHIAGTSLKKKEAVVEGGNPLRAQSPGFLERAPISATFRLPARRTGRRRRKKSPKESAMTPGETVDARRG